MNISFLHKIFCALLFLSITNICFASADDVEDEPRVTYPELPSLEIGKRRLYVARSFGDVAKAYQQPSTNEKVDKVARAIVFGRLDPFLPDMVDAFALPTKMPVSRFELYSLFEDALSPVLMMSKLTIATFIDIDEGSKKKFIFAVGNVGNNYDPDVGMLDFEFKNDGTHVLVMARQEYAPDQEKLTKYQQALLKEAEDEDDYSFVAPSAKGKWGIRVLTLEKTDARFCEKMRITPFHFNELKKQILEYSLNFVEPGSKFKSNALFNLACMSIARSKPAKKFRKRSKKAQKDIKLYSSHVLQEEIQANYIELKKIR